MSDLSIYRGLNEEGLKQLALELNKQAGRAETYNALADTAEGKLMLVDMNKRLAFIRKQYKYIDSTREEAPILLATIQATELELEEWVDRLTSYKELPKQIGEKLDVINRLIKEKKRKPDNRNRITPTQKEE